MPETLEEIIEIAKHVLNLETCRSNAERTKQHELWVNLNNQCNTEFQNSAPILARTVINTLMQLRMIEMERSKLESELASMRN